MNPEDPRRGPTGTAARARTGSSWRCSTAARERQDPVSATAGPAERLLLVEVEGPWGRDALRESRFDRYLAGRLHDAADGAGVRPLAVRRPVRHAAGSRTGTGVALAAVADLRPGRTAVQWYSVREPRELLDINLRAPVERHGPQRVALVCTHGRHDVCCALLGRPVAAALVEAPGWDVWECSHLGGDRFAPNVLLLPDGDLFGGLDPTTAVEVLAGYAEGRMSLSHHRGRMGTPGVEQAVLHHSAVALNEDRRGAVRVDSLHRSDEHHWTATVVHTAAPGSGRAAENGPNPAERYQVRLSSGWSEPARLTCQGPRPSRVLTYRLDELRPLP